MMYKSHDVRGGVIEFNGSGIHGVEPGSAGSGR